ncbi:unnamed protein product [Urochloa humidicola]
MGSTAGFVVPCFVGFICGGVVSGVEVSLFFFFELILASDAVPIRAQFLSLTVLPLPCSPSHSLFLPCSIFMPQMDTGKKMAPASVTFSVARARAEVVVSSGLDAAERDEEKATADLARGMKD